MRHLAPLLVFLLSLQAAMVRADADELKQRREQVHELMGDHAIALFLPAPYRTRSRDIPWPYRQHSNLYYLTLSKLPGTHLMLVNNGRQRDQLLFAKMGDPAYEVWEGKLPTAAELQAQTGISTVYAEKDFEGVLRRLLNGYSSDPKAGSYDPPEYRGFFEQLIENEVEIWMELGRYRRPDSEKPATAAQKLAASLRKTFPEVRIRNLTPELEALRRVKSDYELERMQRAIDITRDAHLAAMKRAPGASHEYQVQAEIEYTFRNSGACCRAFPSIVASGANATILHYGENSAPMNKGDLLLMDIGAEVDIYAADITRTIPVSGKFSDDQRAIYELVLVAQREAMEAAKPGLTMGDLSDISQRRIGEGLVELGLITENVDAQVESYTLHSLGHSVGLDVHDSFEYPLPLEAGNVMTIEPGVYVRPQDIRSKPWYDALDETQKASVDAALERFGGIGVRIEDEILITRRGAKNLSEDIPVTVEDIETIMADAARQ